MSMWSPKPALYQQTLNKNKQNCHSLIQRATDRSKAKTKAPEVGVDEKIKMFDFLYIYSS